MAVHVNPAGPLAAPAAAEGFEKFFCHCKSTTGYSFTTPPAMRAATRTLHATLNTNAAAATAYLVVQRAQRDLNTDVSPFQRPRAMLAGQSKHV